MITSLLSRRRPTICATSIAAFIGAAVISSGQTYDVDLGDTLTVSTAVTGAGGFFKTGGGTLVLTNPGNSYTGTTTISNGSVVITSQSALGADGSPIVVTGSDLRGFGGGSLVLNGTGGGIVITRDLSLQGLGPISDRGAAFISSGNNTLSGSVGGNVGLVDTRIISADGTLTLTGPVDVAGTAGTHVFSFGGVNQAGASFYNLTGILTGTGTLESTGGGTLFLNPSNTSGFSGVIRVGGSAASGQSVVRISNPGVLGTRTAGGTGSVLDMNGGILAVLMDTPVVEAGGAPANIYGRASSSYFVDHSAASDVIGGTVTFGNLSFEDNNTQTFNGRNGFNISIGTASVIGGNANSTFTNNLQGGILSFTGNFWNNTDNTGARVFTISGNGNTVIDGNINASSAAFDHSLTKTGTGTLTIRGTASTLDGATNINGGTLAINRFTGLGAASSTASINIGTGGTAGTLTYLGAEGTGAGETTARNINLASTSGATRINASQSGSAPSALVITSDLSVNGGAASKTLTLAGTSMLDNEFQGAIPNGGIGGTTVVGVTKGDEGTWVLSGTNTYSGNTTITEGRLKVKANGAASIVINDASNIVFTVDGTDQSAGGTLEFVGQPGVNNVESLGVLVPTQGMARVRLTPGAGGTASLNFSGLGGVSSLGASVNFLAPTPLDVVTINGQPTGFVRSSVYYNGSNFAYSDGGAVRAPIYGTDANFVTSAVALTPGSHNEVTGSLTSAAATINSLKMSSGNHTLTLSGVLAINDGAATAGGILVTGGDMTIEGTGVSQGLTSGALVIRVDGASDSLTLSAPITNTTNGGLTKSGAGTLILAGANDQNGTTEILEGTIQLAPGGRLSPANRNLTIRKIGTLDLNGISSGNSVAAFNGTGRVTNSNAAPAVLTVGNNNGTGVFSGIIEDGAGQVSVVKVGTGAQSWNGFTGLSTYTGSTTIGSTGIVSATDLANGGLPSSIGASSSAASNLVFNGASATQAYGGLNFNGTAATNINRLFTFGGTAANSGARLQANGVNSTPIVWTNLGALEFGTPNIAQGLVLGGTSQADNTLNPQITDNGTGIVSVYKADTGVWVLGNASNTYTGVTEIRGGALSAVDGSSLSSGSNLVFNGGIANAGGVLVSSGTLARNLGTGAGQMRFATPAANTATFRGGFAGGGSKLTVNWGSTPTWGSTTGFLDQRDGLLLGHTTARNEVEIASGFSLGTANGPTSNPTVTTAANSSTVTFTSGTTAGLVVGQSISGTNIPSGAYIASINSATQITISANATAAGTGIAATVEANLFRTIRVDDNTTSGSDNATISGVIAGGVGTGIRKVGGGILTLNGANTYTGQTNVNQGTLVVTSLGSSGSAGPSSVGDSALGNSDAGAVTLGNGGTGGALLQYTGPGETSDRKIRLNSTTGSTQIHSDGTGTLVLTNVANDMAAGNKTLFLRGTNASGNTVSSLLADNGGTLGITVDGSATWILNNASNSYSGLTTSGAGALGIGADTALGTGTLLLTNGNIFAYGADRTVANVVQQNSNSTQGFIGDHSLTFTNPLASLATTANFGTNNNIDADEALTFGGVTANLLTANRVWTIDGAGNTVVNGDITTTTTFGVALTKTGTGVLTLNGAGSNFNQNNANIDLDNGTLRLGANGVIPDGAGRGNVIFSPEATESATLDLNGQTETINGLTSTGASAQAIDNTSGSAATLTIGADDGVVNFNGSIGNSGGGALSIIKTGTAAGNLSGTSFAYTGTTQVATGGSLAFTNATPVNTTGITVAGNAELSFINGAGVPISGLTTLNLGAGGGATTLGLDLGTASDTLTTAGAATTTGTVNFALSGVAGLTSGSYDLLVSGAGGFGGASYAITNVPGGFSFALDQTDPNRVRVVVAAVPGDQVFFWTGDLSGSWSAISGMNTNWERGGTDSGTTPGATDVVIFSSEINPPTPNAGNVIATTLDGNRPIDSLQFNGSSTTGSASVSIAQGMGGILTLNPDDPSSGILLPDNAGTATISAPVELAADQTWTVGSVGSPTPSLLVSGVLSGTGSLTKQGTGTVTITGANTRTGSTRIDVGVLNINNELALGANPAAPSPSHLILSGGTLRSAATLTIDDSNRGIELAGVGGTFDTGGGTMTIANVISGTGNLTKAGGNTLILNATNTYAGVSTVNGGALRVGNNAALSNSVVTLNASGTVLEVADGVNIANAITIADAGNDKALRLLNGASSGEISGPITVEENTAGNFRAQASGSGVLTISGVIENGSGTVARALRINEATSNTGTVVLSGANTYTGVTEIRQGTLRNGASDVIGGALTVNATVAANPTATYDLNGNNETIGTLTMGASSSTNAAYVNTVTTGTGTLTLGGNVTTAAGNAGSQSVLTGNVLLSATRTFTVADAAAQEADFLVAAAITGPGGLTKAGAGTLELSGASTYGGTTTVNAGRLLVTGSITGAVTVAGGTLGGTGTVGAVTVNSGVFSPGNSIGTINSSALTLNGTSIFELEISTGTLQTDLVNTGAFSLDAADTVQLTISDLNPSGGALALGTEFTFINYTAWNGNFFTVGGNVITDNLETFALGGNLFQIDYNDNGGTSVSLVVVPEPGIAVSLIGGFGLLVGLQRTRRRRTS